MAIAVAMLCLAILVMVAGADDAATAYLGEIKRRIKAAWNLPPKSDGLRVTLRYTLARDGSVSFVRVEKNFGQPELRRFGSPGCAPCESIPTAT